MSKIIYISGPMTGIKNVNRDAFNATEIRLRKMGFVVLNPTVNPDGLSYEQYMRIDFAMLAVCSAIYMLAGHLKSKGATAELAYAKSCGFDVFYQSWVEGSRSESFTEAALKEVEELQNLFSRPVLDSVAEEKKTKLCTELTTENVDNS